MTESKKGGKVRRERSNVLTIKPSDVSLWGNMIHTDRIPPHPVPQIEHTHTHTRRVSMFHGDFQ